MPEFVANLWFPFRWFFIIIRTFRFNFGLKTRERERRKLKRWWIKMQQIKALTRRSTVSSMWLIKKTFVKWQKIKEIASEWKHDIFLQLWNVFSVHMIRRISGWKLTNADSNYVVFVSFNSFTLNFDERWRFVFKIRKLLP